MNPVGGSEPAPHSHSTYTSAYGYLKRAGKNTLSGDVHEPTTDVVAVIHGGRVTWSQLGFIEAEHGGELMLTMPK